jgi:peroxiredoxin family protein
MFAIISNGVIALLVPAGTAFEWDGVQYPANWCNLSSPEEKAAIGMVDVIHEARPDDRYYWVTEASPVIANGVVKIGYTKTPKDLAELQKQAIEQVNATAGSILAPSDYMVIKATETVTPMDATWSEWRETIREQARSQQAAVNACTTVAQLAALSAVDWASEPV